MHPHSVTIIFAAELKWSNQVQRCRPVAARHRNYAISELTVEYPFSKLPATQCWRPSAGDQCRRKSIYNSVAVWLGRGQYAPYGEPQGFAHFVDILFIHGCISQLFVDESDTFRLQQIVPDGSADDGENMRDGNIAEYF